VITGSRGRKVVACEGQEFGQVEHIGGDQQLGRRMDPPHHSARSAAPRRASAIFICARKRQECHRMRERSLSAVTGPCDLARDTDQGQDLATHLTFGSETTT